MCINHVSERTLSKDDNLAPPLAYVDSDCPPGCLQTVPLLSVVLQISTALMLCFPTTSTTS